jgi:hypothetical protein
MITTKKVLVAEDDPMAVVLLKRAFATTRTATTFRFVTLQTGLFSKPV